MLTERKQIGRFEEFTLPDGSVVYKEVRGDAHFYWGEIRENRSAKGGYSAIKDTLIPGASGISKYLDPESDPLMYWATRLERNGIAALASEALASDGDLTWLGDERSIKEALEEAKLLWAHVRNKRADEGSSVHEEITFALATGGEVPSLSALSAEARGYGQAKLAWWRDRSPVPLAAEQVTVCHSRRFGGTFDLLAELRLDSPGLPPLPEYFFELEPRADLDAPARVLIDDKTREKPRTYKSDHVQLAGYEIANRECGIGPSELRLIVVLLPDGSYHEVWGQGTEADFNSALLASQSGKHLDKRMKAAEKAREAVSV